MNVMMRYATAAAILALSAVAPSSAQTADDGPEEGLSITGVVRYFGPTGPSIAGAAVELRLAGEPEITAQAVTDRWGAFRIEGLAPRVYEATIERLGDLRRVVPLDLTRGSVHMGRVRLLPANVVVGQLVATASARPLAPGLLAGPRLASDWPILLSEISERRVEPVLSVAERTA